MENPNKLLEIVANSNITVLLLGESGAGKEVAARYVHDHSPRKSGPFIAINCGAIAKNLMESILEGSAKGAFTGSIGEQKGAVRAAEGGTLFLDEIGELPMESQSKLLRILQEKTVMPIGSTQCIPVNFRLICATNKNLKEEVAKGQFREDLFFRINVFPVELPPLRERDDFNELANQLWKQSHSENDSTEIFSELTLKEIELLKNNPWPGNIRQLKNVLQRYAILKFHKVTLDEILADEFAETSINEKNLQHVYQVDFRRKRAHAPHISIIEHAMNECMGNKSHAAEKLGISRGCLCYQLQKKQPRQMAG